MEQKVVDFKQRILTAMNHEEPDRVPVMGLIMDPATVNAVLDKKAVDFPTLLKKPVLGFLIRTLLNTNWYWTRMYYGNFSGALRSAIKLGFDANWTIYAQMKLVREPETALGWAWHDPFGRLWELGRAPDGSMTVNYSRALCDTQEKWEAWTERNRPVLAKLPHDVRGFHKRLVERYGDRIYPMGYAAPGIFENTWQPIGFVNFTKMVYQKPEFVRRVVDFHTDLYMKSLEAVMDSGVEVVFGGDDLGQKTGPMMRPELVEKLFGASYRRVTEYVHKRGGKFVFHTCGNVYQLLDKFVDWGFDGIITMEPTAGMDLGKVREQVGHKLVLIGNLDVSYLMVRGSKQEVEDAVRKAIYDAASGGGYILSTCHSHPFVDPVRLQWMIEAAHKYGKYPLNI